MTQQTLADLGWKRTHTREGYLVYEHQSPPQGWHVSVSIDAENEHYDHPGKAVAYASFIGISGGCASLDIQEVLTPDQLALLTEEFRNTGERAHGLEIVMDKGDMS
jgi:hypothetical protein